jgi:hypothetical protein
MIADGDGAGFQVMLVASAIDSAVPDCGTESERSGGSAQSEKSCAVSSASSWSAC